jgi:hypothetical protein
MKKHSSRRESTNSTHPEDILAEHGPGVREMAEALRRLIRQTIPDVIEAAYPGWHGIGYRHPASGYFCAIFPGAEGVRLGFEFGALLPDPNGLLEGSGRQVRYVTMREGQALPVEGIQTLLRAALDLPAEKQVKLELIRAAAKLIS